MLVVPPDAGVVGVTDATAGGSVYTAAVVAVRSPVPLEFTDEIVNVYWMPAVRLVNVYAPPYGADWVVVAGEDTIE